MRVCGTRLEKVGLSEVLMLQRFDRERNPDAKAYARFDLAGASCWSTRNRAPPLPTAAPMLLRVRRGCLNTASDTSTGT